MGISATFIAPSAVAGIPENTLFTGFIWVAVKTAFVCRQAGNCTGLRVAEDAETVAIPGTETAARLGESPAAAGLTHRRFPRHARMFSGLPVSPQSSAAAHGERGDGWQSESGASSCVAVGVATKQQEGEAVAESSVGPV